MAFQYIEVKRQDNSNTTNKLKSSDKNSSWTIKVIWRCKNCTGIPVKKKEQELKIQLTTLFQNIKDIKKHE